MKFKAKVISAQAMVDLERSESRDDIALGMMLFAGKTVTIVAVDEDNNTLLIAEDKGNYYWEKDLFVSIPDGVFPTEYQLLETIHDNDTMTIDHEGNISIGCETIELATIKDIYETALKHIAIKPKRKTKKKTTKKKK